MDDTGALGDVVVEPSSKASKLGRKREGDTFAKRLTALFPVQLGYLLATQTIASSPLKAARDIEGVSELGA